MAGHVDERTLPEQCHAEVLGVECQVGPLGITHADGPGSAADDEVAVDHRLVIDHNLLLAADEPGRDLRFGPVGQVGVDGAQLARGVAIEDLGVHRLALGPEGGHAGAGAQGRRIGEVALQPFPLEALTHLVEGQGRNTHGTMGGEGVAGHAAEAVAAHELPADLGVLRGDRGCRHRGGRGIEPLQLSRQRVDLGAEDRHAGGHVRTHLGALGQDLFERRGLELAADASEVRRDAAFVAEIGFSDHREPFRTARGSGAAHLIAGVTGQAVELAEGQVDLSRTIGGRFLRFGRIAEGLAEAHAVIGRKVEARSFDRSDVCQTAFLGSQGQLNHGLGLAGLNQPLGVGHCMAGGAIEGGELFPAGGDLDGVEGEFLPIERTDHLTAVLQAVARDGAAFFAWRSPLHLELGFAAALEVDDLQLVQAGLEGEVAILFRRGMDAVVVQERPAIDGELGAVIRPDPEAVLAVGRDVDETGEPDAPVVVGVGQAQVEGGGDSSGFRGHGQ